MRNTLLGSTDILCNKCLLHYNDIPFLCISETTGCCHSFKNNIGTYFLDCSLNTSLMTHCVTLVSLSLSFINYVRMVLAIFDPLPYPHVRVRKIYQTPPPYSYLRFHLVFQHNKMLLEKDQLHQTPSLM